MTESYAERIRRRLQEGLDPQRLVIRDDSHRHRGHAGWRSEGETHFHVTVVSSAFSGRSRVDRQRMVHALLRDELAERVHALELRTLTPEEDRKEPSGSS